MATPCRLNTRTKKEQTSIYGQFCRMRSCRLATAKKIISTLSTLSTLNLAEDLSRRGLINADQRQCLEDRIRVATDFVMSGQTAHALGQIKRERDFRLPKLCPEPVPQTNRAPIAAATPRAILAVFICANLPCPANAFTLASAIL